MMDNAWELGRKAGRLLLLSRMGAKGQDKSAALKELMILYENDGDFRAIVDGMAQGMGFDSLGCSRRFGLVLMPREKSPFCSNLDISPKGGNRMKAGGNPEDEHARLELVREKFRRRIFFMTVFISTFFCEEDGEANPRKKVPAEAVVNGIRDKIASLANSDRGLEADCIAREFADGMGGLIPVGSIEATGDDGIGFSQGYSSKTFSGLVNITLRKMEKAGYLVYDDISETWMPSEIFHLVAPHIWKVAGESILKAGKAENGGNGDGI